MPSLGSRRWLRWGLVVVAFAVLAVAAAVAFVLLHAPGNVSHPNVEFTNPTTKSTTTTTHVAPPRRVPAVDPFYWPRYGFDTGRNRYFANGKLHPPLRVGWSYNDFGLLEFPPVLYRDRLYFIDDNGSAKALDSRTGRLLWQHQLGTLAASAPAIGVREGLVFFVLLSRNVNAGQNPGNGMVAALSIRSGQVIWTRDVPPGTETSPLVWKTTLYYGDLNGNVYALRARDGRLIWSYSASGAVKGGLSLADGIVYFGDYAGRAYALNADTGHQIWAASTSGSAFGFGSGNFYSSPAVAFGRVYMGNTDGRVYSFAAHTGQLAWATGTGAYVYASPAVADVAGLGPTVFLGSYDGNFYAFDAQSGAVRWSHSAGGRISGSPTIVGNVVYFSTLGTRTTTGLDTRTGQAVFSFSDGAFSPVIADPQTIFLTGYSTIYQMYPPPPRRVPKPTARRATKPAAKATAAPRRNRAPSKR